MSTTLTNIEDVQYTQQMDLPVLVREVNERLFNINLNMESIARELFVLTLLATTKSFEITYANNVDINVFVASLDVYIARFSFRAPVNNMTVVPGISAGGVGAFTPILLDPDIPGSAIPVTDVGAGYETLSVVKGGNAAMTKDDIFQVQTSNGTQGDPLYITVKFDIIGLSEEPVARIIQIESALVAL
jgi:hypothetical protein